MKEDWTILKKFEEASKNKPQTIKCPKDVIQFLKGISVEHNDNQVKRLLSIQVSKDKNVPISIEFKSATSRWRQGLHVETDGYLMIASQRLPKLVLWYDTAPSKIVINCSSTSGEIRIWNIWDAGSGTIDSLINCSGIIVNENPDSWELLCNDGYPDDDFNDLIVRMCLMDSKTDK